MSGGSYNYLARTSEVEGAGGILTMQTDLLRMAQRLEDFCPEAARETRRLLLGGTAEERRNSLLDRAEAHVSRLRALWHAIEWHDSSDWGVERVNAAVDAYRDLPDVEDEHPDCYRPGAGESLVHFSRRAETVKCDHLDYVAAATLADRWDRRDLRFLEVRLEEALVTVRAALEQQGRGVR